MFRETFKIGKKFCFPDVPSSWIRRTVEIVERSQNRLPKKRILFPFDRYFYPLPKIEEEYEEEEKHYYNYYQSHYKLGGVKDGFSWCLENYSKVTEFLSTDKMEMKQSSRCIIPKKGMSFDVVSLLGSSGMNEEEENKGYLVRSNGDKVEVQSLRGKNIVVCCFNVPAFWLDCDGNSIRGISTMCSKLNYEMVMVAKMRRNWANDEDAFNHFFSGFPSSWLAIPFSDTQRRDYVCTSLGLCDWPRGLLVDNNQKVVVHEDLMAGNGFFSIPFSVPNDEFDTWWKTHSQLDSILESDFVCRMNINNNLASVGIDGNKVFISEFKEKLVGLYLCYDGGFIRTLELISQECKARNQEFHIVLVYLPYKHGVNPHLFMEAMNHALHNFKISVNSNWWVSPFNDFVSRRLWELYYHCEEDQLIILDPHMDYADPHGKDVINHFGIDAYPFTRELVVRRELEAIKATTLESLLVHGSRDHVLRMNFNNDICNVEQVPIAELRGKIVLLFASQKDSPSEEYYFLLDWYDWAKTTTSLIDFEVVFVHVENVALAKSSGSSIWMPWLVCPYDPQRAAFVNKMILKNRSYCLAAFGTDGSVITLSALDHLGSYGPKGFASFECYDGLRNEVIGHLEVDYEIDMSDVFDE